jgi:hypothetical protein
MNAVAGMQLTSEIYVVNNAIADNTYVSLFMIIACDILITGVNEDKADL